MPNDTQKTILVKKADGTSVRMSLAEAMKERNKEQDIPTEPGEFVPPPYSLPDKIFQEIPSKDIEKDVNLESIPTKQAKTTVGDSTSIAPVQKKKKPKVAPPIENKKRKIVENRKPEKKETFFRSPAPRAKKINLPTKETPHELATTTPVKEIFVDEAISKKTKKPARQVSLVAEPKKSKDETIVKIKLSKPVLKKPKTVAPTKEKKADNKDFGSPLEESVEFQSPRTEDRMPILPAKKYGILDKILSKLSFSVSKDLNSRIESLATSFIKEVRTADQVRTYLVREKETGGLGLEESQADELITVLKEIKNFSQNLKAGEEKKQGPGIPLVENKKMEIPSKKAKARQKPMRPASSVSKKIHDIVPPKEERSVTTSPVEELKMFNLKEFRRLSGNAEETKEILLEKFKTLKSDSYLLYLDGVKAWKSSPLNQAYKQAIIQATQKKKTIENVLAEKPDSMTMDELRAIMDINRELS